MALTFERCVRVCLDERDGNNEFTAKWLVRPEQLTNINGDAFLKLPRSHVAVNGFARFVMGCQADEESTLTVSLGYDKLVELRNVAAAAAAEQLVATTIPEIFRKQRKSSETQQKLRRTSRSDVKRKRDNPKCLRIDVPAIMSEQGDHASQWTVAFALRVMEPVSTRDDLCIEFDETSLLNVIKFMRVMGFAAKARERSEVAKGVWMRKDPKGNVFFITKVDGRYKRCDYNGVTRSAVAEAEPAVDEADAADAASGECLEPQEPEADDESAA